MTKRTLLIGLGNPGEEHAGTYHNAGWEILEFFEEKLEKIYGPAPLQKGKNFHFRTYDGLNLVYPDTFMNRSGTAVKAALAWFHKQPEDAVIFHDDSDLALGEYKEAGGGSAGHHGIESIFEILGDVPLLRVRIGIRDPLEKSGEQPRRKAGDFVLKKISKEARVKLNEVFQELSGRFLERS